MLMNKMMQYRPKFENRWIDEMFNELSVTSWFVIPSDKPVCLTFYSVKIVDVTLAETFLRSYLLYL